MTPDIITESGETDDTHFPHLGGLIEFAMISAHAVSIFGKPDRVKETGLLRSENNANHPGSSFGMGIPGSGIGFDVHAVGLQLL
jgi:hypothetical protein